jgi:CBS-domain-containing membrane protein
MQAADVMTTNVISVGAEAAVREIVDLLLKNRISAVPVIDDERRVLGIVSEGDLMRRVEDHPTRRHSWWLGMMAGDDAQARDFIKLHGRTAREIMTRNVVTVEEDAGLGDIASLLEEKHIKRVPVVRDGKLVGIVSRANLLQGLAVKGVAGAAGSTDDRGIREALLQALPERAGVDTAFINVIVDHGAVELWGIVDSDAQKKAAEMVASETPGVTLVQNRLSQVPQWIWAQ